MPLSYTQTRLVYRTLSPGISHSIAASRLPVHPRQPPQWPTRAFSTTKCLRRHDISKARNHYETLNVAYDASPADIKKSFYSLSKSYHPDHNPDDASTVAKFHSISEAYSVLGTPAKRAAYDRDVISRHHGGAGANAQRRGSYHSSGPVGGRPASGLSRRKTQFRGPPPSFHRNGGWGEHGAKRSAAHDESTGSHEHAHAHPHGHGHGHAHAHPGSGAGSSGWTAGPKGGMGPGQDPFGHTLESEPAHFDHASHRRTQRAQDHRRAARILRESGATTAGQESMPAMFFVVSGVLIIAISIPLMLLNREEKATNKQADIKKQKKTA